MQKEIPYIMIAAALLIGAGIFWFSGGQKAPASQQESSSQSIQQNKQNENPITPSKMKISSPAFNHNGNIPAKYTCDGENISPPLEISSVPPMTKSIVLIVDDPDAPAGTWVHWVVFNLPPETTQIAENSIPNGATEGTTSFGKQAWGGPCPPSGAHHYQFKIYALDIVLQLPASSQKADVEKAMDRHILDHGISVGLYQRNK